LVDELKKIDNVLSSFLSKIIKKEEKEQANLRKALNISGDLKVRFSMS